MNMQHVNAVMAVALTFRVRAGGWSDIWPVDVRGAVHNMAATRTSMFLSCQHTSSLQGLNEKLLLPSTDHPRLSIRDRQIKKEMERNRERDRERKREREMERERERWREIEREIERERERERERKVYIEKNRQQSFHIEL